jgi:hypothetical protein
MMTRSSAGGRNALPTTVCVSASGHPRGGSSRRRPCDARVRPSSPPSEPASATHVPRSRSPSPAGTQTLTPPSPPARARGAPGAPRASAARWFAAAGRHYSFSHASRHSPTKSLQPPLEQPARCAVVPLIDVGALSAGCRDGLRHRSLQAIAKAEGPTGNAARAGQGARAAYAGAARGGTGRRRCSSSQARAPCALARALGFMPRAAVCLCRACSGPPRVRRVRRIVRSWKCCRFTADRWVMPGRPGA